MWFKQQESHQNQQVLHGLGFAVNPLCDFGFRGGRSFPSTYPDWGFWEVTSWDREERGCPVLFGAQRKPWRTYQKWKNKQTTNPKSQCPGKSWKSWRPYSNGLLSAINSSTCHLNVSTCRKGQGCWGLDQARRTKSSAKTREKHFFVCVCEKKTRHKTYYIFPCSEEPRTSDEVPESWIVLDTGNCLQRPEMVQRATSWVRSPLPCHNNHPVLCKVKAGKEFSPANTRCREKEEQVSIPHL